jgi:hypothetical protein
VSEHGVAVERTFDCYAQDEHGNVWYMGEESLERKNGRLVRADDSWQAGPYERPIQVQQVQIVELRGGKAASIHTHFDRLELIAQLGVLPTSDAR